MTRGEKLYELHRQRQLDVGLSPPDWCALPAASRSAWIQRGLSESMVELEKDTEQPVERRVKDAFDKARFALTVEEDR